MTTPADDPGADSTAADPDAAGGAGGGGAAVGGDAGRGPAAGSSAAGGGDVTGPRAGGSRAGGPTKAEGGASSDDAGGDAGEWEAAAARRRGHAIRGTLAAALCLEALMVLFVPRAVARVGDDGLTATKLTILIVIAALLFLTAGLVKRPAGLVLGSVLQVAVFATGLMVGAMYFLGLLFAGVWAYMLWVRQEILRAAAQAGAPGGPDPGGTA